MDADKKSPDRMTSSELERAIREHQEYVRKLIEEAHMRRIKENDRKPPTED